MQHMYAVFYVRDTVETRTDVHIPADTVSFNSVGDVYTSYRAGLIPMFLACADDVTCKGRRNSQYFSAHVPGLVSSVLLPRLDS